MAWEIHGFGSDELLVRTLAAAVIARLTAAIETRGRASLAVSGGSTPVKLFQHLARQSLAWDKVSVTLVDERWVPEDDGDSNAGLVRKHLLQHEARRARLVGLKTDAVDAALAIDQVEQRLAKLDWPLDVIILGMGEDGHTASLFPGAASLAQALDTSNPARVCAVTPPVAAHQRMTLTLAAILSARQSYLHVTGNNKWQVLQSAMAAEQVRLPVSCVLHRADPPLGIYYRNGM